MSSAWHKDKLVCVCVEERKGEEMTVLFVHVKDVGA